ncbi:hypothetical protein [Exiguobacterium profundum]
MERLNEYGISNIVAIDDTFNEISGKTKISSLDEVIVAKFDAVNDLEGGFIEYVSENSEQYMSDYFDETGYDQDAITQMLEFINQSESNSYSELIGIHNIEFYKCIPEVVEIRELLIELKDDEKRTLIILDRKLAGKNELEGKTRLKSILTEISEHLTDNGHFFLVLYSSDPKQFSTYEETIKYLSEDLNLSDIVISKVALHINFLKKDVENESEFIKVLRKSQKANYVNSYNEIFEMSIASLRERIWDLNRNESLFYYDYLVEGQQIDQIIFGIFTDKFKRGYMKFMEDHFEKLINPIRNSLQKYENNRDEEDEGGFEKTLVKYRFIKEVNSAIHGGNNTEPVFSSDDISFGDIIRINDHNYIVVSQNCDITIRQNGKRAVQSFQLIRVKETRRIINAKWLVDYFKNYSNSNRPNRINLNTQGEQYFKHTFYNPSSKTELQNMGFGDRCLEEIENTLDKGDTIKQLSLLTFEGYDTELSEICEYIRDKDADEIYTIPCFWLDALLVRKKEDNIINDEFIDNSKEIRLATKRLIKKDYEEMIRNLSILPKNSLEQAFSNNLFNPLINIEPLFNEKETLNGFKLNCISRSKKLKPHVARAIHLEMIVKQTREAVNESIPI